MTDIPTRPTKPAEPEHQRYSSGERVFGPPGGTFDADWAATALRSLHPGLDHTRSVRLTSAGWDLLRTRGLRGPALADALRQAWADQDLGDDLARDAAAVVTETVDLYRA